MLVTAVKTKMNLQLQGCFTLNLKKKYYFVNLKSFSFFIIIFLFSKFSMNEFLILIFTGHLQPVYGHIQKESLKAVQASQY